MTYAVSDIHGCYDEYKKLLEEIHFGEEDTLYVLGDVLDRGPSGFQILCDIASRPNVLMLKGNHEKMALDALPAILRVIGEAGTMEDAFLTEKELDDIDLWFCNGGETSLGDFLNLDREDAGLALEYLRSLPLYRELEVGGRKFVLVHGGLGNFSPAKPLSEYEEDEIVWSRPDADTFYYEDKYVVLGHTQTPILYGEAGKMPPDVAFYKTGSYIDIDCGCAYMGGRLGCLCLETMEEFYVSREPIGNFERMKMRLYCGRQQKRSPA